MTPDQITQLRQALKNALELIVGGRIKFDAFPPKDELEMTLEAYTRASEEELEQALALLPCSTCNGTKKVPKPPKLGGGFSSGMITFPDQYVPCPGCK